MYTPASVVPVIVIDSLFALVITGKPVPVSTSSTSEESTSTLVGVSVFASSSCMFVMSEKSEMFPTASTILVTMLYSLTQMLIN